MIKHIAGSVLFLTLGLGLSRFIVLLVFLMASNVLSVEGFASLSLLVLSGTFLTYVFTFGLNIGLLKYSSNIEKSSEAECLAICRFAFKIIISALFLVALIAASSGWLDILVEYNPKIFGNKARVCGLLAFVILGIYKVQYTSILTGLKNFKAIFIANVLEAFALLPGLWASKTVEDIFVFLCVSSLVSCIYLAIKTNNIVAYITLNFSTISLKFPVIIMNCLSFYFAGLMSMGTVWVSQAVFFSSSIDLEEFAKFSFAFRIYTPFIFLFTVVAMAILPYIANKNIKHLNEVRDFIIRPIILIFVLGVISAACVYVFYGQIAVYFDLKYKELAGILGILILAASVQGAVKIMVNKMIADVNSNGNLIGEIFFSTTLLSSVFIVWYNNLLSATLFSLIILSAYLVSCISYSTIIRVQYRAVMEKHW